MNNSVKHIRQDWVDIIKGFAIISVVVGHIAFNYPDCRLFPVSDIIAWLWHVPVFFMVGGFFISDEKLQHPIPYIYFDEFRAQSYIYFNEQTRFDDIFFTI